LMWPGIVEHDCLETTATHKVKQDVMLKL